MRKVLSIILLFVCNHVCLANNYTDPILSISISSSPELAKQNAVQQSVKIFTSKFFPDASDLIQDDFIINEFTLLEHGNLDSIKYLLIHKIDSAKYIVICSIKYDLNNAFSFFNSINSTIQNFNGNFNLANLNIAKINELQEELIFKSVINYGLSECVNFVEYSLEVGDPEYLDTKFCEIQGESLLTLPFKVNIKSNIQRLNFEEFFHKVLKAVSMIKNEMTTFSKFNKKSYCIVISRKKTLDGFEVFNGDVSNREKSEEIFFRNESTIRLLLSFFIGANLKILSSFEIKDSIKQFFKLNLNFNQTNKFRLGHNNNCKIDLWKIESEEWKMNSLFSSWHDHLSDANALCQLMDLMIDQWRNYPTYFNNWVSLTPNQLIDNGLIVLNDVFKSPRDRLCYVKPELNQGFGISINVHFTLEELEKLNGFKLSVIK